MSDVAILVDREHETSILTEKIDDLTRGISGFHLIEGPAGIGKTALLRYSERYAQRIGMHVLPARASDLERDINFGLIQQLFDHILIKADPDERRRLFAGAATNAASILGSYETVATPLGDFSILHSLYWFTANLTHERPPLLLLLDDLHWADLGSLRFLAYLQSRLDGLGISVIATTRQHEPGAEENLIDHLGLHGASSPLCPAPLTPASTTTLLSSILGQDVEPAFSTASHRVTGGNPLLIHMLAQTINSRRLPPTDATAAELAHMSPEALTRRTALRMAQLPQSCVALAHSVALLGDDPTLDHAAAHSGLALDQAAIAAGQLQKIHILATATSASGQDLLSFVHPLIRTAVYDHMSPSQRITGHRDAARLLIDGSAEPERIASHLLRTAPADDQQAVAILRAAAQSALRRGAPHAAVTYLQRCLLEPPALGLHHVIVEQLGRVAFTVDPSISARYLQEALDHTSDPVRRAEVSLVLGEAYLQTLRSDDGIAVWAQALRQLPDGNEHLRRRIQSGLLNLLIFDPHRPELLAMVAELRSLPFHDSLGGRAFDAVLSLFESMLGEPRQVVTRARRALSGHQLIEEAAGEAPLVCALSALINAEDDTVAGHIETALSRAYERGALSDLNLALTARALHRHWIGDLTGAESDGVESRSAIDAGNISSSKVFLGPWLADIQLDMGQLTAAEGTLAWTGIPDPVPPRGPFWAIMLARARLQRLLGNPERAREMAGAAGERYKALSGADNPAWSPWRSEMALCLHAMNDEAAARPYALEEVASARRWGAARPLGRALRAAALVHDKDESLAMLRESVTVLEPSAARFEHAVSLVELGAALRRGGRRTGAKESLILGLDLAHRCGARSLAERAETELLAAGARPRRRMVSGPLSLTPSEARVARLAAQGHSNREIAQQLYVTGKTVEVHLGNAYRKLGISRREHLPAAMA